MDTTKIKRAFQKGLLKVKSLNKSTRQISWSPVSDIMRHESSLKNLFRVCFESGHSVVITEDHSLIGYPEFRDIQGTDIVAGDLFTVVDDSGTVLGGVVVSIEHVSSREFMYDICVPENENFILASGIVAHNSYSISGVSLDIEKSSKYSALKDETSAEFDKLIEAAKKSIKIAKGLRQFRYGVGITSALGPLNRPGVQSRRNLLDSSIGPGYV